MKPIQNPRQLTSHLLAEEKNEELWSLVNNISNGSAERTNEIGLVAGFLMAGQHGGSVTAAVGTATNLYGSGDFETLLHLALGVADLDTIKNILPAVRSFVVSGLLETSSRLAAHARHLSEG